MKNKKWMALAGVITLTACSSASTGEEVTNKNLNWMQYNNANEELLMQMPNGAIGNITSVAKVQDIIRLSEQLGHEQVRDNVWILSGPAYAPFVIEVEDGLIVGPTGEHAGEGEAFRAYIREHISSKPIIGILYDHNHYTMGTSTMLDGDEAIIVAHPDSNDIISRRSSGGQANTIIPEMAPHLASRAMIHYGNHNPDSGVDATVVPLKIELGHESAWMPATHILEDGESITIGGLEIVAYHHETDAKDNMTFHFPELDLVVSNVIWPTTNMYTLRGDAYRDPFTWSQALRDIRELSPEYHIDVGAGAKHIIGEENIKNAINEVLDARNYAYDQAIRLTNMGVSPDQLKHHMPLPEELNVSPYVNNVYGQFETFAEAFPVQNHGYFSGLPHELHNLPSEVEAGYMVRLAGGIDNLYGEWEEAMEAGEYLWAKEIAVNMYYFAPDNDDYRASLADSLRILGQYSEGLIARNFYIAGALSLEGDETITIGGTQSEAWAADNSETAVDYLRTRINPTLAAGVNGILTFDIEGELYSLEIRNSIAEPIKTGEKVGAVVEVSKEEFGRYYVGELKAADIAEGEGLELLSVFDEYKHIPMYPTNFDYLK